MRLLPCSAATAVLALLPMSAPLARADIEYRTMSCTGSIPHQDTLSPGIQTWSGVISCDLGWGTGYEVYESFSSAIGGTVDVQAIAPGVFEIIGDLAFSSSTRRYVLMFDDTSVLDYTAMTSEYDRVQDSKASPYEYHVREGYLGSTGGYCGVDCVSRDFQFVAEYLFDLPVVQTSSHM